MVGTSLYNARLSGDTLRHSLNRSRFYYPAMESGTVVPRGSGFIL